MGLSIIASSFLPEAVMKVETCRRSSLDCSRVIQPDVSIRSNKRDISGVGVTMREDISFRQSPPACAPRKMRRTLYCGCVMPNSRSDLSAAYDSSEAVRKMLRNASCCKEAKGRFCFSAAANGEVL